jgi:hypothetical protein
MIIKTEKEDQTMTTYNAQMEDVLGNGLNGMQLHKNRKRALLSGQKPLFILSFFALALSVMFPYGLGLAVFVWGVALAGAIIGTGFATYLLLKEFLGKTATFGYAPAAAYLAGKKIAKKK